MIFNVSLTAFTIIVIASVFFVVPPAQGLGDFVRIAFFHIPAAWVSVLAFALSAWWAYRYLKGRRPQHDYLSQRAALLGFVCCVLATVSGAVFAKLTWGAYWNWDPRQITIFVLLLIYGAYFALRTSIAEPAARAKLCAVYSLFACATVPFLVFVIPRYYFSLHPAPLLNAGGRIDMDPVMLCVLLAALLDSTLIFFKFLLQRRDTA